MLAVALLFVLPRIRRAVTRAQAAVGEVGSALDRTLGAIRTAKANGGEGRETVVGSAIERAHLAGLTGARHRAMVSVLSAISVQAAILVVLGLSGFLVTTGGLILFALIAFLLDVIYLSSPISALTGSLSLLQRGLGAAVRIGKVESMAVEEDVDSAVSTLVVPGPPQIEILELVFPYPTRIPVSRGVSINVAAGSQTALVGLSAAGKTTLFALLQRFNEPDRGAIRLGGRDIAELTRAEVRHLTAYVEQDAPKMDGMIRDNLIYGNPTASPDEIAEVLRDTRHELALREALDAVSARRTVLLIAHRLSAVASAEQIVVLENGIVRAAGTHESLLRSDALYRELAATQFLTNETPVPIARQRESWLFGLPLRNRPSSAFTPP
ncbi:ATP-binding cassette domain-containing protein [Micromonospora matsumotoense]|uniref:ATP-binding cassette domain-containing protein n=1 Tax=Micromonospora matsumotoense TaxID=121616 RepID=UPI003D8C64C7